MRARKPALLGGAGVTLTAALVAAYLILPPSPQPIGGHRPGTYSSMAALTTTQATALAASLLSGSSERVSAVVALPAGKTVPATFVAQMHSLHGMQIDAATSRTSGEGTGTAEARLTGADGSMSTWTVMLIRDRAGTWRVTATAAVGSAR